MCGARQGPCSPDLRMILIVGGDHDSVRNILFMVPLKHPRGDAE